MDSPRKRALGCVLHAIVGAAVVGGFFHSLPDPSGLGDWVLRLFALPTLLLGLAGWGLLWEEKLQQQVARVFPWWDLKPNPMQAHFFPIGGLVGFVVWCFLR